jgi:hypothetical protein
MLMINIHAVLMIAGFLILLCGFITARYMKKKRWWLKAHRFLGVSGASLTILGFFLIVFNLLLSGRPCFTMLHGYMGLVIALLAFVMPALGFMQLKIRKIAGKIRPIHRFFGWIMLTTMFINIILGMRIADIF